MNYHKKTLTVLLLAIAITLSACSSGDTSTPTKQPEPTSIPSASPSTEAPKAAPTPSPSVPTESETPAPSVKDSAKDAINNLMKLAKEGKVPHSEYSAQKGLFDEAQKAWGKPDKNESAGKGMYATYSKKHIVFGYNKGLQIFDVRSEHPDVQKLTLSEVTKTLGETKDIRESGEDAIYVYKAGKEFELKFIVPKPTKQAPNPHVHHISVFYPDGAVNLMLDGK